MSPENQALVPTDAELDAAIEEAIANESTEAKSEEETTDTTKETSTEEETREDTKQETVSDEKSEETEKPDEKTEDKEESEESEEAEEESEETSEEKAEVDLLKLHGLDKKYNSIEDAIAGIPHAERTIGDLNYEKQQMLLDRQRLAEGQQSRKPTKLDLDKFSENPEEALAEAGYKTTDEVVNLVNDAITDAMEQRDVRDFHASLPDFKELEPVMIELFHQNPALSAYGQLAAAKELYRMASDKKRQATATKPTVEVVKTDAEKKERAKTVGGKQGGGNKQDQPKTDKFGFTPQDYLTKSEEEIESTEGIFGDT